MGPYHIRAVGWRTVPRRPSHRGRREEVRLRVWPAFAVQPLPLSQGAPPPPGAGSKFRHLHPWFRGPDPETAERLTEKRSASQRSWSGSFGSGTAPPRGTSGGSATISFF